MVTANTVLGKAAALAMLPSLALGVFAMPALAGGHGNGGDEGVKTTVITTNMNGAMVVNAIGVKADTGGNTANGGKGAAGGNTGTSGSGAGNGGEGGDGDDGGDAKVIGGEGYAEGGDGGYGAEGGNGGNTGDTGDAGYGAAGGAGGRVDSGNATAAMALYNAVNVNTTEIALPDCNDCAQYNEYYEAADAYYEKSHAESSVSEGDDHSCGWNHRCNRGDEGSESWSEESSSVKDTHWEVYYKEFVPVTTMIMTTNINVGAVMNLGSVEATTGDNTADGGNGGKGGTSGASGSSAGNGGEGGDGEDGGDATVVSMDNDRDNDRCDRRDYRCHDEGDDEGGAAFGGDGADGAMGGQGGNTGATGAAGDGGVGGNGGVVVTGHANAMAGAENIVNVNDLRVTRIVR